MSFGAGSNGLLWRDGDDAVDLSGLGGVFAQRTLNPLMAQGPRAWESAISAARTFDGPRIPLAGAVLRLPFEVADYVDFYSSLEHATNLGRMFRPDQEPLLPNWRWLPVAYHGRAGSVVCQRDRRRRPRGQRKGPMRTRRRSAPRRRLDFELELGFVVGDPAGLGQAVPVEAFADHVFGVVLVNDWSARDIQAWEYVPLGPYLGKSFADLDLGLGDAARGARRRAGRGPAAGTAGVPHLAGGRDWGLDIALDVELNGETISRGNAKSLYWTLPQQLAHATSNGARLRTGDLMASGTISGAEPGSEGSMIELFHGERFLEDGDEVVLRGSGANGVALGEVRGRVLPALA